jgi:hypothetical protein
MITKSFAMNILYGYLRVVISVFLSLTKIMPRR